MGAHAAVLAREAEALAEREDIARLLAEEEAQAEEVRMRETLALAGKHLDGGGYEEARRLLTSLEKSISRVPSASSARATCSSWAPRRPRPLASRAPG